MFPFSSTATHYSGLRTSGHKFKVLLFTMSNMFTANSLTDVNKVIIMRYSLIIENIVFMCFYCVFWLQLQISRDYQQVIEEEEVIYIKTMTDAVGSFPISHFPQTSSRFLSILVALSHFCICSLLLYLILRIIKCHHLHALKRIMNSSEIIPISFLTSDIQWLSVFWI